MNFKSRMHVSADQMAAAILIAVVGLGCAGSDSGGRVGTGGATAGSGGNTAATGGNTPGTGGSTAATGGRAPGTGGIQATGTGGSPMGSGGAVAGGGGRIGTGGVSGTGGVDGRGGSGAGGGRGTGGGTGGAGTGGAGGRGGGTAGVGGSGGAAGSGGDMADFMPCPASGDCKVMPVGDSITWQGYCSGAYRVDLFRLALTDAKHMTFVGRQMNGPDSVTVGGTTTPFPKSHEGYSGYTIDSGGGRTGVSTVIDGALTAFPPHIVLLMIGTNDVDTNMSLATAPTRLGALMDRITSGAPNALLVVAQIVPTQTAAINTRVEAYNSAIPGLVQSRAAAGKHVVTVDMYGAFVANPNYMTALLSDRLHPNEAGCMVMATTWYDGIKSYLR